MENKITFELVLSGLVVLVFLIMLKHTKAVRFQNYWNEAVNKRPVHRSTRYDYIIANHIDNREVLFYVLNPFKTRLFHLYKNKIDKEYLLEEVNKSLTK